MIFRWLIRTLFILPVVLSLGGWWWSTTHMERCIYQRDDYYVMANTWHGVVVLSASGGRQWPRGLTCPWSRGNAGYTMPRRLLMGSDFMPKAKWKWLGFGYSPAYTEFWSEYTLRYPAQVSVPYWLLLLVFTGMLWGVWHVTRPRKIAFNHAFPVQVKAKDPQGV